MNKTEELIKEIEKLIKKKSLTVQQIEEGQTMMFLTNDKDYYKIKNAKVIGVAPLRRILKRMKKK
jgi:hypothetical protein